MHSMADVVLRAQRNLLGSTMDDGGLSFIQHESALSDGSEPGKRKRASDASFREMVEHVEREAAGVCVCACVCVCVCMCVFVFVCVCVCVCVYLMVPAHLKFSYVYFILSANMPCICAICALPSVSRLRYVIRAC
jgi:hypothetical protein